MGYAKFQLSNGNVIMILVLCGPPASGKSYITEGLKEKLHWPRISFGGYVRSQAEALGLKGDRKSLQELGQSLIDRSPPEFIRNVLSFYGVTQDDNIIIDGLRHNEIYSEIRDLFSESQVALIYVEVTDSTLRKRLLERGELDLFDQLNTEPTELQVKSSLRSQSDLILDGEKPLIDSINKVLSFIENKP